MSFDAEVIKQGKLFAQRHNISLSRLTEFFLKQAIAKNYTSLYDIPVADWVNQVAEGPAIYDTKRKTGKQLRKEFYETKK